MLLMLTSSMTVPTTATVSSVAPPMDTVDTEDEGRSDNDRQEEPGREVAQPLVPYSMWMLVVGELIRTTSLTWKTITLNIDYFLKIIFVYNKINKLLN
jgi:hypothetical protein